MADHRSSPILKPMALKYNLRDIRMSNSSVQNSARSNDDQKNTRAVATSTSTHPSEQPKKVKLFTIKLTKLKPKPSNEGSAPIDSKCSTPTSQDEAFTKGSKMNSFNLFKKFHSNSPSMTSYNSKIRLIDRSEFVSPTSSSKQNSKHASIAQAISIVDQSPTSKPNVAMSQTAKLPFLQNRRNVKLPNTTTGQFSELAQNISPSSVSLNFKIQRDTKRMTGSTVFQSFEKSRDFDYSSRLGTSESTQDLVVKSAQFKPAELNGKTIKIRIPKKKVTTAAQQQQQESSIISGSEKQVTTRPKLIHGAPVRIKKDLKKLVQGSQIVQQQLSPTNKIGKPKTAAITKFLSNNKSDNSLDIRSLQQKIIDSNPKGVKFKAIKIKGKVASTMTHNNETYQLRMLV